MMNKECEKVFKDVDSLKTFLESMKEFEEFFCDCMYKGTDFTLKLEVHGNNSKLIHCRVLSDRFNRPSS